jgi:hypothetical protein
MDLYIYLQPPDRWFDNMACSCGTHSSAFTKLKLGWLDPATIAQHRGRAAGAYELHTLGMAQPPPPGRVTAVQVGSEEPYLMIEARQKVDQFDAGIPSEGVIVYEVRAADENPSGAITQPNLQLRTRTALQPGTVYTSDSGIDTGVDVRVTAALNGGFSVLVEPAALPWTSVSEGRSTPGAPVTAVEMRNQPGRFALFLADPNGGVYTTSGNAQDGWAPWSSVSEGRSAPGGTVTAVEIFNQPGSFAVFLADPAGGVYTTSGNTQNGWGPWSSVSEGSTRPGAPVSALEIPNQRGRFAVFLADPAGGVYTTSGNARDGWAPWSSVSEGSTAPGGTVTALPTISPEGHFALFLADPNGGVYTTEGSTQRGWGPWSSVSEGSTRPGARVTAVQIGTRDDLFALLLADPNGGVYTTSGSRSRGWAPWSSVSEGRTTAGGAVTAVAMRKIPDSRIAVFLADPNGGVYTTVGSDRDGWGMWSNVREGRTTPGAPVSAVRAQQDQVALFLADPNGGIYTSSLFL